MSNFGFGFGPAGPNEPGGRPGDPDDLAGKMPLFAELQRLLSGSGGPVNWDLARQLAISGLAAGHQPIGAAERSAVTESVRLADLWLDEATDLPSGLRAVEAWSQVDWVEKTIGTWSALCDPVASRVVSAMSGALPAEVAEQAGPMAPMMAQIGGMMFGAQLGQGLSALAAEVVCSSEIGLPLGPSGTAALVVSNLDAFASDLQRPVADVRLFIALREAAYQRLFSHVPWLRQQLIEAVDAYGRGIEIDPQAISTAMAEIDPANPESMQAALSGGLFEPKNTDAQNLALRRLETLLALIEGWVDTVVIAAAQDRMQGAAALAEGLRRRRAAGGPAEQTFATLVGLDLRPRRLRDAASLWAALGQLRDPATRDSLWNHPDLLPTSEDLDDPIGYASNYGTSPELSVSGLDELSDELDAIADENPVGGSASSGNVGAAKPGPSDAGPSDAGPPDAGPSGDSGPAATGHSAESGSQSDPDNPPEDKPGS